MAKRHKLQLTDEETQILGQLRDTAEPAYLRERAGALLKIAVGMSPHKVARSGLLKQRKPDTIYAWLRAYRQQGVQGLRHKPGKGRKSAFAALPKEDAEAEIQHLVGRDPAGFPPYETRWTLRTLAASVSWLKEVSLPRVRQTLRTLGIGYKRGRAYVHSPDAEYTQKLVCVQQALQTAKQNPQTHVAFYQDEFAFRRQPTLGKDWTRTATKKPLAHQILNEDEVCYGMGALNAHTGDLVYQQTESATVVATHALYSEISQRYPKAERIYVIQDDRPVHLHPNLLAALLPQTSAFQKPLPPSWIGKFSKKIGKLAKLPIEVLQLPTYAPWTNPIKKLWRWVRQAVLHLHRLAEEWHALQQRVITFMQQFRGGSKQLLRYVGLLPV